MQINKVLARSILNKSKITNYTINCYTGCQHSCIYCYARFMRRFTNHKERWGSFVDAKVNAPDLLEKQLNRPDVNGEVMMSSVCDGWQGPEEYFKLSRRCLEILLVKSKLSVTILTKSFLINRDFDILERFKERINLGITITTLEPSIQRLIEPYSSKTDERLSLLKEAKDRLINTYAFVGPLIPGFSDTEESLNNIFKHLGLLGISKIYVDKLNYFNWFYRDIKEILRPRYPKTFNIYFEPLRNPIKVDFYTRDLENRVKKIAKKYNLEDRISILFC
ncbi:MAG: radical SAM protein [Candidatus Omnitrophica bacterium]|nr:radical SAM protein [Candidatus Omnitrophota bacterium]